MTLLSPWELSSARPWNGIGRVVGKLEVGGVLQDRVRGFVQMQCLHMGVSDACLNWLQALSANGLDTSKVPGLSYPT